MIVEPAKPEDLPRILDIQRRAFGRYSSRIDTEPWLGETLEELEADFREKTILVAKDEKGTPVGSVRFMTVEGVVFVRKISVDPDNQGHGVGRALIGALERSVPADAHKIYLCTLLRTERNIPFFLSLGYRPESLMPDHYRHADLICFGKYLKPRDTGDR